MFLILRCSCKVREAALVLSTVFTQLTLFRAHAAAYISWSDTLVIRLLHLLFECLGEGYGYSLVKLLDLEPLEVIIA